MDERQDSKSAKVEPPRMILICDQFSTWRSSLRVLGDLAFNRLFVYAYGLGKSLMYHELTDHFIVSANLSKTWEFFSSAANLPLITPAWLRFQILTPAPVRIELDSILDYSIRWMGIPVRWRTKIIDWAPMRQFIDLQVRGPYALWHHQHTFRETNAGTECTDRVIYRVPIMGFGKLLHRTVVRRQLRGIFLYRREAIAKHLGEMKALQDVTVRKL